MNATKVNAGPAESNGRLLLDIWRDSLHVTCGLTACTPGSAAGPTLGNEYGKTLPFRLILKIISLADSQGNCVFFYKNFHLTSTTLLLYLVTFLYWVFHFPVGRGSGTSSTGNHQNAESNDARTLFHTFCGRRTVHGPDLQNILCQSFDYFTTMPKLRWTYGGRLIYKTSYNEWKAFHRYDSHTKS